MANVDAPRGFILHKSEGKQIRFQKYSKDTGAAIYRGDLVKLETDGAVAPFASGDGKCLGVAMEYKAASANEIIVCDDPDAIFVAQTDAGFQLSDIGSNADVVATAGSAASGQSAYEIRTSTYATSAALPLKVLGLVEKDGNAVGSNALVFCKLNNSVKGGGDGAAGI